MNCFQFPEYRAGDIGEITFADCSRYRLGILNDEGWHRGKCRFQSTMHRWGEFYQVDGDLRLDAVADDWHIRDPDTGDRTHFLFYFRSEDFECDARAWRLEIVRA